VTYRVFNGSASYTLTGNFLSRIGDNNYPISDIALRLVSQRDNSKVVVDNVVLTTPTGGYYAVLTQPLNASYNEGIERETLIIRANTVLGENISNGFSITGTQVFTYDTSAVPGKKPQPFELLNDIYVGRQICNTTDQAFVNFGNYQSVGRIAGFKWNDLNQNGIPDPGEPGLEDWVIKVFNATTFLLAGSNTTYSLGEWLVLDLPYGTYIVNETLQPGWIRTYPPSDGNHTVEINGTTGIFVHDIAFGNYQLRGNISGVKWNDYNGNGIRDVNDNPLSGWVITLKYQNGTVVGSKTTGADGSYVFDNLAWEKYTLSETLKSGWKQTYPAGKTYTVEINATSLNVINRDFGNQLIPGCCNCPVKAYFTFKQVASPARTIQFTDASTGYVTDWSWNFGDGKTSVERNPLHTYSKAGTYTVKQYVQTIKCDGKTAWVSYTRTVTVK
jgi:hypothetical protein